MSMTSPQTFTYGERRIAYSDFGSGPRVVILTHGLLMDRRMYTNLAPALAARGHRVITIDVLGHGASDAPHDMHAYSMTEFGRQVLALMDHLGIDQAVIGGTSLGANVSLEVAALAPTRVRALFLEMPVLENALPAAAAVFMPLALTLRMSDLAMRGLSWLTRKIPRSHFLLDVALDFVRRDPRASLAVLDGITFGRIAPQRNERRRIRVPVLLVGHKSDPVHPFSDADTLARDVPDARILMARSLLEWRLFPTRLDGELAKFLDSAWAPRAVAAA